MTNELQRMDEAINNHNDIRYFDGYCSALSSVIHVLVHSLSGRGMIECKSTLAALRERLDNAEARHKEILDDMFDDFYKSAKAHMEKYDAHFGNDKLAV